MPPRKKSPDPIKLLDIACGVRKPDGATGIDHAPESDADIFHDLFDFPWPIADGQVLEARCFHFAEHIPHWRPGWTKDGWFMFWEEVHRILAPEGTVEIQHPYARHDRAFYDPTHTRYIHEYTWYYLNKDFRDREQLGHYETDVDFDIVVVEGQGVPDQVMQRSEEFRSFAREFYFNVLADLHVILKKR